jgi:hypothetical protein
MNHFTLAAIAIAIASEREAGGKLEPPPTFCRTTQSKDSRNEIKQQRQQKQRKALNSVALASDLRVRRATVAFPGFPIPAYRTLTMSSSGSQISN